MRTIPILFSKLRTKQRSNYITFCFEDVRKHLQSLQVLITQSCPTLCDSMDCSPPGSSAHLIFQARMLEWVAISFSRGYSWLRDWTQVFCIVADFLLSEPTGKPHSYCKGGCLNNVIVFSYYQYLKSIYKRVKVKGSWRRLLINIQKGESYKIFEKIY